MTADPKKDSQLTALAGASVAATDGIRILDVSDTTMGASGTNKLVPAGSLVPIGVASEGDVPVFTGGQWVPGAGGGGTDLEAYIGTTAVSGYAGRPSLIDPASTVFSDGAWTQWANFSPGDADWWWGAGDPVAGGGADLQVGVVNDATHHRANFRLESTNDSLVDDFQLTLSVQAHEGADMWGGSLTMGNNGATPFNAQVFPGFIQLAIAGDTGQTDEVLDIKTSAGVHVFRATGDNKLGFFNHAVAAQPTGVAVTAAGVHAAGVALGLWTA